MSEPGPDDIQPIEHETLDRIATGTVSVVPFLALGHRLLAGVELAPALERHRRLRDPLRAHGLRRDRRFPPAFTHRSFATKKWLRGVLAVCGSAAIEGPVISWVADHRKHHAFADQPGDPHSPHVDHGVGWRGALRGLAHAHMGWLFLHTQRGSRKRYAPDLLADPVVSYVDRTFLYWAIGGLGAAFGLGWLIGGTLPPRSPACCGAARCGCSSCTT